MRLIALAVLAALTVTPAFSQSGLPDGVDKLLTCGHVYLMKSEDAKTAGDTGGEAEFFNRGDNLLWQARTTMESAGMSADAAEGAVMNAALTIGFRYGAG
ncbi:MAG: hypothetical protein ACOVO5_04030, partial [Devosia sp.]